MKRMVLCVLIILICIGCLVSCNSITKNEFFSNELLERNFLLDMPLPPGMDNSRLQFGTVLYFNISNTEYERYVEELLEYLREKESVYYLGYSVGQYLLAEMMPYDVIAPITEEYVTSAEKHDIFFSLEEGFTGQNEKFLVSPVQISVHREEGTLGKEKFEYNTWMAIYDDFRANAEWNPCGAKHTFDNGVEYKIAGSTKTIVEYACVLCGATEWSDYVGDLNTYDITIVDTDYDYYLYTRPNEGISGTLVTINAMKIEDKNFRVTANGTELLPIDTEYDDMVRYQFIMPSKDVTIMTEIILDNEETPSEK